MSVYLASICLVASCDPSQRSVKQVHWKICAVRFRSETNGVWLLYFWMAAISSSQLKSVQRLSRGVFEQCLGPGNHSGNHSMGGESTGPSWPFRLEQFATLPSEETSKECLTSKWPRHLSSTWPWEVHETNMPENNNNKKLHPRKFRFLVILHYQVGK